MMINPILRNEMKTDSRRFRFYLLLMLYVALLGLPIILFYYHISSNYRIDAGGFSVMYTFLACTQAIILMFIVPALTANAITAEREKQTLDILLTTKMTPRSIIWGKLLAAVSKVILLIICAMPIYAIVLFLGGIRMVHIVGINLYLMLTTVFISALCIWISTIVKTSKFANVTAYFAELGFVIVLPLGIFIGIAVNEMPYDNTMEDLLCFLMNLLCVSPAVGYGHLIGSQLLGGDVMDYVFGISNTMLVPGWLISVGVEVVLSILFIELAIRKLNPLKKHSRARQIDKKSKKHKSKELNSEAMTK